MISEIFMQIYLLFEELCPKASW